MRIIGHAPIKGRFVHLRQGLFAGSGKTFRRLRRSQIGYRVFAEDQPLEHRLMDNAAGLFLVCPQRLQTRIAYCQRDQSFVHRIEVDFSVNGAPMGASIAAGRHVEVSFAVRGRDELDAVEIVQDGRVVQRAFAVDAVPPDQAFAHPLQVRLEWGWGPWGALALDRVCDWEMDVALSAGRIARFFPCLQSMPFDEARRHHFARRGEGGLSIRSYSSRRNAYRENPNQSVVLEIAAGTDAVLELSLRAPVTRKTTTRLADLHAGSHNLQTGPFPNESYQWHRLVPLAASSLEGRCTLELPEARSYVYLRASQKNGHIAWASPVFMNYR